MQEFELYAQDVKCALVGYAEEMYQYTLDLFVAAKKRSQSPTERQSSSSDSDGDSDSSVSTPVPITPSLPATA